MRSIGEFSLVREIGDGFSGSVVLGNCSRSGRQVAVKLPSQAKLLGSSKIPKLIANEFEVLTVLKHPRVVEPIGYNPRAEFFRNGQGEKVWTPYLALEMIPNGEVCALLCEKGRFSEETSRFYFLQLMEGLQYIHSQGFAHRDIKPENMMFDSNFDLKLIDFAFATPLGAAASSVVGTPGYISPEMYTQPNYDPSASDVFAAGVVLFIMAKGAPPFNEARRNDPHFVGFCRNRARFWEGQFKKDPDMPSSQAFVDLIDRMLEPDPAKRITVLQILQHSYLASPPSAQEAKDEIRRLRT